MSWYTEAQGIELSLNYDQTLRQDTDGYGESALPEALSTMKKLDMEDLLHDIAKTNKYRVPLDYLLCALYPKFEKPCRKYYEEGGKKLAEQISRAKLKDIDMILANAVYVAYQNKKNLEDQPEGPTEDQPENEEVQECGSMQQIYTQDDVIQSRPDLAPSRLRNQKHDRRK